MKLFNKTQKQSHKTFEAKSKLVHEEMLMIRGGSPTGHGNGTGLEVEE